MYLILLYTQWRTHELFFRGVNEGFNQNFKVYSSKFYHENTLIFFLGGPAHPWVRPCIYVYMK
ncbi:hypothetical protein HanIR_Chr10g0492411 [Helianthus annuus]|nr:hypothetical protein HanIR_Chr10g0492411 [Helianthus annuus]